MYDSVRQGKEQEERKYACVRERECVCVCVCLGGDLVREEKEKEERKFFCVLCECVCLDYCALSLPYRKNSKE